MKKALITFLHIGYWFVYLLLAMMVMYIMMDSEGVGENVLFMAFAFVILLPGIVTFYVF